MKNQYELAILLINVISEIYPSLYVLSPLAFRVNLGGRNYYFHFQIRKLKLKSQTRKNKYSNSHQSDSIALRFSLAYSILY